MMKVLHLERAPTMCGSDQLDDFLVAHGRLALHRQLPLAPRDVANGAFLTLVLSG
jgi:hypothetical protein